MKILLTILIFPLLTLGQTTAPKDSMVPLGTVIGNQTVIQVPVYPPGYTMAQALIYYPDDYFQAKNANKKYPLFVFLHGAGEGRYLNISEVTNTSLPYLIKNGLKPYGIDPETGDTIKFIVVSPHCATCGGSYSFPQLKYTIPYLFTAYRVDTSCVWVGGLSSGGSCTWSTVMGYANAPSALDTFYTKRITGIMPMANGGYDLALNNSINRGNLDTTDRRGLGCLYVIGDQDPGYNAIGFFAYQSEMKKYCQPGRYFDSVILGGTHSANVWNTPFPLSARLWSKTMNSWTQMWVMRKRAQAVLPPPIHTEPQVKAILAVDSQAIHYTTTWITLTDNSLNSVGGSWDIKQIPKGAPAPIITSRGTRAAILSGLVPGTYVFGITVSGDGNTPTDMWNVDSATVTVTVIGPPACPLPRKVVSLQIPWFGAWIEIPVDAAKIGYDDGTTN